MMNLIFKAAIFDMDGTLVDTLEDIFDGVNEMLEHYNFPARTLDEVRNFVGNGACPQKNPKTKIFCLRL